MTHPNTLAEWEALTGDAALTAPEHKLIAACRDGKVCKLGDGKRPEGPDPERNIRADLLRWLIVCGCANCMTHEQGVQLVGAYITGQLDVSFATAKGLTLLTRCRFSKSIEALQTRFELLNLADSSLPSLNAQGAEVKGDVFLRDGFEATGEVSLSGASIGGHLDCSNGCFSNEDGDALNAQGAEVKGGVFLRDGFEATGEVNLSGANIGGQLDCSNGCFSNEGGKALNLQRMHVAESFFFVGVTVEQGSVVLAAAHIGDLCDDPHNWPVAGRLILDGFTYDRISAAFTDAPQRLEWLRKGAYWDGEFFPQPYNQLAKVLREMGHEREARTVLIHKEKLLADEQIQKDRAKAQALRAGTQGEQGYIGWHWLRRTAFKLGNGTARRLVGYGYAPQYAFYWLLGCLAFLTVWYFALWQMGGFVPNSPVVLNSQTWADVLKENASAPGPLWAATAIGKHYETFYSAFYAADVFIPLIDFGQETAWTATTANSAGWLVFITTFVFKSFGWFLTALGAAAITGIIRRD